MKPAPRLAIAFLCLLVSLGAQTRPGDEGKRDRILRTPSGWIVEAWTAAGPRTLRRSAFAMSTLRRHPVPGTDAAALSWTEANPDGPCRYTSFTRDGRSFSSPRITRTTLELRHGRFDPLVDTPVVESRLRTRPESRLRIVQFRTQLIAPYREALRRNGVTLLRPLAHQAAIVALDPLRAEVVAALPFVRAVVPFHPAYKLDESLRDWMRSASRHQPEARRLNLLAFERGARGQDPLAKRVRALGGRVELLSPGSHQMQASLTTSMLTELLFEDALHFVDPWVDPRLEVDMDLARSFHGADLLEGVAGLTGSGIRGEVADSGVLFTHPEFAARPLLAHGTPSLSAHGTSTTGQLFASGVMPQARGILPSAQGISATWGSWSGGNRYAHTQELVDPNLPWRCLFQSNSGGQPLTTEYSSDSFEMDLYLFDFPKLTILQSQSNFNSRLSRAGAWSKNCVAVGGVRHEGTLSTADDHHQGASFGPAADGRVKPEFASFYDGVFTTSSPTPYNPNFGGTSAATPLVAGCFGLFYAMWHQGLFGNPTAATAFDSAPMNTTARAFLIASARQWDWINGSPANATIDRDRQGWGHPDLQRLHDHRQALYWIDESVVLEDLERHTHELEVAPGQPLLKATLVWRDPPGTVSSTHHLVNDLDLRLVSPSGQVYLGNHGLTNHQPGAVGESLWSTPGGQPDDRNSVECVFLQNPEPGVWIIEVHARSLAMDAHLETPSLDSDYALCVLGATEHQPTGFHLALTHQGQGDARLTLLNVPAMTTHGYCFFSDDTSQPLGSGSLLGLRPTALTWASLSIPETPGNPLHWSWPIVTAFPAVPFEFPPAALPPGLFPLDAMAVALGPNLLLLEATSPRRVFP